MKAKWKGRGLVHDNSVIFLETGLSNNGELGLERDDDGCSATIFKRGETKCKNYNRCHQNEDSETVKLVDSSCLFMDTNTMPKSKGLKFADGKSCVFLKDELKNKAELGLGICNAMYGGRQEVGKLVEYDSKYAKNFNTSQQEAPELQHVDDDDPQYMIFLGSTVQKGTSYESVLRENGSPLFIHYEKEDGAGAEPDDICTRRVKNVEKEHDYNGGENDDDPHYSIFLASTIQKGTSYVSILKENGTPLFIHYEKEDGACAEPDDMCKRGVKNVWKEHDANGGENGLPLFIDYEKEDGCRRRAKYIKKGHNAEGKAFGTATGKYKEERANCLKTVLEKNVSVVVDDEMFEPPPCPVSTGNRPVPKSHYRYDINSRSHKESCTQNRRNNGRSTQSWRISEKEREEEYIDKGSLVFGKNMASKKNAAKTSFPANQNRKVSEDWGNEYIDEDYLALLQNKTSENNTVKASFTGNHHEVEKNTDEDYWVFLQNHSVKFPGNQLVEYDCNHSEDVEVLENNYAMGCKERSPDPFICSKEYMILGETCKLFGGTMESPCRQKIISILKKPYSQSEYEKLTKDFKVRNPMEKDLSKKLKEVSRDKHKRLNILRGFFFWLQNVPQVGAFKPWNDPACLAIMPGSC